MQDHFHYSRGTFFLQVCKNRIEVVGEFDTHFLYCYHSTNHSFPNFLLLISLLFASYCSYQLLDTVQQSLFATNLTQIPNAHFLTIFIERKRRFLFLFYKSSQRQQVWQRETFYFTWKVSPLRSKAFYRKVSVKLCQCYTSRPQWFSK